MKARTRTALLIVAGAVIFGALILLFRYRNERTREERTGLSLEDLTYSIEAHAPGETMVKTSNGLQLIAIDAWCDDVEKLLDTYSAAPRCVAVACGKTGSRSPTKIYVVGEHGEFMRMHNTGEMPVCDGSTDDVRPDVRSKATAKAAADAAEATRRREAAQADADAEAAARAKADAAAKAKAARQNYQNAHPLDDVIER